MTFSSPEVAALVPYLNLIRKSKFEFVKKKKVKAFTIGEQNNLEFIDAIHIDELQNN